MKFTTEKLNLIFRIWKNISRARRRQFYLVILMSVVASIFEIAFIGSIFPLLILLSQSNGVSHIASIIYKLEFIKEHVSIDNIFLLTILSLCILTIISAVFRMLLVKKLLVFSFEIGVDIGKEIYRRTLYQPYIAHISRNSSEVIVGISTKAGSYIMSGVIPLMIVITNALILGIVTLALVLVDPWMTLVFLAIFVSIYFFVGIYVREKLRINGQHISMQQNYVLKNLQEGLGSIRDTLLDGTQELYCNLYHKADILLRNSQASSQFLAMSPRYLVEAAGIIIICLYVIFLNNINGEDKFLPLLGVFALAAQRMLPLLQSQFNSWANFESGRASIIDTLSLLEQKYNEKWMIPVKKYDFTKQVKFQDVSFCYPGNKINTLKNVDLTIIKGDIIGLIGATGGGKSTFIDLFMGLLIPTSGKIIIDESILNEEKLRAWQLSIAHVPQQIFLTDASIAENIAFGVSKENIDMFAIQDVAKIACIHDDISKMRDGYFTVVGERGARLSGGQRQRIGMARALYKKCQILVLDEATSALDYDTESLLMNSISENLKGLTKIIISHRYETIKACNRVFKIENGRIDEVFDLKNILNKNYVGQNLSI